jgi:hypothetical protein
MAHITYRQPIQEAPTSTTTKGGGVLLSAVEVDGNMKSLNEDIQLRLLRSGDSLTGAINMAPHATVASATMVDLASIASNNISINGTASIESFGNLPDGSTRQIRFVSTATVVHGANIILPYAANITAIAGDYASFVSAGAGVWRLTSYSRNLEIPAGTIDQYYRGDKTWRDLYTDIRSATLDGISLASSVVIGASDTVIAAFGKLQKQIQLKQDALVSGSNIKTINGSSIVGSGNIQISNQAMSMPADAARLAVNTSYMINGNSSSGFVFYLPNATPGQFVEFIDMYGNWETGSWYVGYDATGGKVMGLVENMLVNRSNYNFKLVYTDTTGGWRIV